MDISHTKTITLPARSWCGWLAGFCAAVYGGHYIVLWAYHYLTPRTGYEIDVPPHWPFSIYNPRGPHGLVDFAAIALSVIVAVVALWWLPRRNFRIGAVAFLGLALVLLTNAIQGTAKRPLNGFYNPVAGGISGEQYYHDALRIADGDDTTSPHAAASFLRAFNQIQPSLRTHARTHPPGAVLLYWYFRRPLCWPPVVIAVVIAVFCVLISAPAMRSLARSLLGLDDRLAGYAAFLYLLLPAVQIYYCATLDAVIATLLLAAAALWRKPAKLATTAATAALVTLASFLTFGFAWVLPVLLAIDFARKEKRWWRIAAIPLLMLLLYAALKAGFGFSYLQAFRTASHLENPMGFRGTSEPVSFAFTRLEDVTEMAAFFGPFLLMLLWRGFPILKRERPDAWIVAAAAIGTLVVLFLTGAYHTGETARACQFLYPYLLLPVIYALRDAKDTERLLIAALVFAQALAMQTWGNWFW